MEDVIVGEASLVPERGGLEGLGWTLPVTCSGRAAGSGEIAGCGRADV